MHEGGRGQRFRPPIQISPEDVVSLLGVRSGGELLVVLPFAHLEAVFLSANGQSNDAGHEMGWLTSALNS